MMKKGFDSRSYQNKFQQRQVARMTKDGCPSQTDVIFVVMDALEGVLALHYELNGYCQEPDERHSERSRVSELFQSASNCQAEQSRVLSEFHSCQAEDEGGVFQVQDDDFHLPEFHSSSLICRSLLLLGFHVLPLRG